MKALEEAAQEAEAALLITSTLRLQPNVHAQTWQLRQASGQTRLLPMRSSTSLLNITPTLSKTWRQLVTTISRAVATTMAQAQMMHLPKKRSTRESAPSQLIRA